MCKAKGLKFKETKQFREFFNNLKKGENVLWGVIPSIFSGIKTIDEFCQLDGSLRKQTEDSAIAYKYNNDYDGLATWLYKRIYSQASWMKYFEVPLVKLLKSLGMETYDSYAKPGILELSTSGWQNYPCVTDSTNVVAIKLKDGSLGYEGGGFRWYGNGRKQNLQTNEMSNYHCGEDGRIKDGLNPKTTKEKTKETSTQFANVEPASGIGVVTRNVQNEIPILLKQAGLEGQPINQDTINKLYDILSKK